MRDGGRTAYVIFSIAAWSVIMGKLLLHEGGESRATRDPGKPPIVNCKGFRCATIHGCVWTGVDAELAGEVDCAIRIYDATWALVKAEGSTGPSRRVLVRDLEDRVRTLRTRKKRR